jgi:O-antigen/teichoic acid export membrane protein
MTSLSRNVRWNVIEVVATGLGIFLVYRVTVLSLGIAALGLWSLVIATTSVAKLADLGVSGGLARLIPQTRARSQSDDQALVYIETGLIFNLIFYSALCLIAYWPALGAISAATQSSTASAAKDLLPYALLSLVAGMLSGMMGSALVGLHRSDFKSKITIISVFVQTIFVYFTITKFGIASLAIAQILQAVIICVFCWIVSVKVLSGRFRFLLPYRVSMTALKEITGYGLRVQGLTIVGYIYEPAIRIILTAISGTNAVGTYELASRLVLQVRQLLVSPSTNLLPIISETHERDPSTLVPRYHFWTVNMMVLGFLSMLFLIIGSPIISILWLRSVNAEFISYVIILSIGWAVNIAATPAFLIGLGIGYLRWNIAGAAFTSLLTLILSYLLGYLFGGIGCVIGVSLAVAAGAAVTWVGNGSVLKARVMPPSHVFRASYGTILRHPLSAKIYRVVSWRSRRR